VIGWRSFLGGEHQRSQCIEQDDWGKLEGPESFAVEIHEVQIDLETAVEGFVEGTKFLVDFDNCAQKQDLYDENVKCRWGELSVFVGHSAHPESPQKDVFGEKQLLAGLLPNFWGANALH